MADADSQGFNGSSDLAQRIRSARARVGMTRKQLAAAACASERYLATLETGGGNPSVEMLIAIAEALNVAPAELLPLGGELDELVASAAMQLRRLSPERIKDVLTHVGRPAEAMSDKARRVSLVGLRGAGKSSLGRDLAERLGCPFIEVSKEVEKRYGGSISVMMEINGPATLRRLEAAVLEEVIAKHQAVVIAAPGAIVSYPALYDQLLRSTWTVWLEASPEDHMQRVVEQGDLRPMAGNRTAMADLKLILAARQTEYARADVRIDTSSQNFQETLDLLETAVNSL